MLEKIKKHTLIVFILSIALVVTSGIAKRSAKTYGEAVSGTSNRSKSWKYTPSGMQFIKGGIYQSGCYTGRFSSAVEGNSLKSVSPFFCSKKPITNSQFREFKLYVEKNMPESDEDDEDDEDNEDDENDGSVDSSAVSLTEEKNKKPFIYKGVNIMPDYKMWMRSFSGKSSDKEYAIFLDGFYHQYHYNEAYGNFPAVCRPITVFEFVLKYFEAKHNEFMKSKGLPPLNPIRFLSASEYDFVSRGGLDMPKFPHGGPYVLDGQGNPIINVKNYRCNSSNGPSSCDSGIENGYGLKHITDSVASFTSTEVVDKKTSKVMLVVAGAGWTSNYQQARVGATVLVPKDFCCPDVGAWYGMSSDPSYNE